jgi:serine/threonine protein kinase
MDAISTVPDLLHLLEKSRLLERFDLDGYLRHPSRMLSTPKTARELAAMLVHDKILTRFQADNLLRGKWRGFFLGSYKVLRPIATGSTGVVYLCEHGDKPERVAVKVLEASRERDPESVKRFQREARAAAALDHPNIVRGFELGREDFCHYFVMEFVEGYSIKQLVRDHGPLESHVAIDYLRQAAAGLQHAHDAGLVHRDIKPSNLIVNRSGTLKILDMGLALFLEGDSILLTKRGVLGSLDYIAPEQATDSHAVDARADIFSLGATFWFCLTGVPLRQAALEFIQRPRRLRCPEENRTDVSEAFWHVLRTMMDKEPAERYQTTQDLLQAINPLVAEAARDASANSTARSDVRPGRDDSMATITYTEDMLAPTSTPMTESPALVVADSVVPTGSLTACHAVSRRRRQLGLVAAIALTMALAGDLLAGNLLARNDSRSESAMRRSSVEQTRFAGP